jgi:alanine racemase
MWVAEAEEVLAVTLPMGYADGNRHHAFLRVVPVTGAGHSL